MIWNDPQTILLIHERKSQNDEYWDLPGNDRTSFWTSVASTINMEFQSTFTYKQCKEKFQNLVREHRVRENYRN
jgi:hypothetical protein